MTPDDYQEWLAGGTRATSRRPSRRKSCSSNSAAAAATAAAASRGRGPALDDLFGAPVPLADGETVIGDDAYLRESILRPQAKVVAGFQPIMPPFEGQIGEEGVLQLIAYIKSLRQRGQPSPAPMSTDTMSTSARTINRFPPVRRQPLPASARGTTSNAELHACASWLLTVDHKRIAILYLIGVTLFFFLGGAAAVLFRLELMTPEADLVESETYNKLFTLHGDHHGLLLPDPGDSRGAGKFLGADDDRRPRSGVPASSTC